MDSTRAQNVIRLMHKQSFPVLMTGEPGTAKTSVALMFKSSFDPSQMLFKRTNFSFVSTCMGFQSTIESSLDKRGGRNFGPPNGCKMTVFIDDISMPEINEWGDQPTNEIVRQLIEYNQFAFLDKDKRGDMKTCEDLVFMAAMTHPGGGRNDIPDRLKRHFLLFNLVLPSIESINDIYGQMLDGRFPADGKVDDKIVRGVIKELTATTIKLWRSTKAKLLPTPAKFHYIFNMRDLSRIFQGILLTPIDTLLTGGSQIGDMPSSPAINLVRCLRHEAERALCDKLTNNVDKGWFQEASEKILVEAFGEEICSAVFNEETFLVDFFRDDLYDENDELVEAGPKVYEFGGLLPNIRERVYYFMERYNKDNPATQMNLIMFDDALRHMMRISRIIQMPRGSALLVGVGGSGKQSLTRMSAYIARHSLFQIKLTKTYGPQNMIDDMRECAKLAGTGKQVTFLFTDAEIKKEIFLEYINSILLTGDVPGMFSKEEMMAATADVSSAFEKARPHLMPTPDNLREFFIDTVRDNLHMVLACLLRIQNFRKEQGNFRE